MALFSKMTHEAQVEWNKWKEDRETQLLRQIDDAGARAGQYLVFTNGGSAVALAAFMSSSPRILGSSIAWAAQQSFLAGLILAGLFLGFRYHYFVALFDGLKKDVYSVYSDKLDVDLVHTNDDKRARISWIGASLAYISFGCFVWGAYNAAFRLPTLTATVHTSPDNTPYSSQEIAHSADH